MGETEVISRKKIALLMLRTCPLLASVPLTILWSSSSCSDNSPSSPLPPLLSLSMIRCSFAAASAATRLPVSNLIAYSIEFEHTKKVRLPPIHTFSFYPFPDTKNLQLFNISRNFFLKKIS